MRTINDYQIIARATTKHEEFIQQVKKEIGDGWQPYGSLLMTKDADGEWLMQPMVQYDLPSSVDTVEDSLQSIKDALEEIAAQVGKKK